MALGHTQPDKQPELTTKPFVADAKAPERQEINPALMKASDLPPEGPERQKLELALRIANLSRQQLRAQGIPLNDVTISDIYLGKLAGNKVGEAEEGVGIVLDRQVLSSTNPLASAYLMAEIVLHESLHLGDTAEKKMLVDSEVVVRAIVDFAAQSGIQRQYFEKEIRTFVGVAKFIGENGNVASGLAKMYVLYAQENYTEMQRLFIPAYMQFKTGTDEEAARAAFKDVFKNELSAVSTVRTSVQEGARASLHTGGNEGLMM